MKFILFYHSLVSDWNHGNAHFLRGVATELIKRGHNIYIYEPRDGWSRQNLLQEPGSEAVREFRSAFPLLRSTLYDPATIDLDRTLRDADVVLVHEWNDHDLVSRIGEHHRANPSYRLFFHDTHHRAVTAPEEMQQYDLRHYDGVLAYGNVLRDLYLENKWTPRAWTWHEAADVNVFKPHSRNHIDGEVVWIGNWGDDERTEELCEFLIQPIADLKLRAKVFGVRYPESARRLLSDAGISYGGWLPNYRVPEVFARFKITVHVPRRPYVRALPGIPTIRPFEALACGIPLVCSPWSDSEKLFRPGTDFLVARNGAEMRKHLQALLTDKKMARDLAASGLETVRGSHTCGHRVERLLNICRSLS
ncbi:MAG: glycosyltransferase [Chthoniobacterales bacterium]